MKAVVGVKATLRLFYLKRLTDRASTIPPGY